MRVTRFTRLGVLLCLLLPAATACKKAPKALASGAQMNVEQLLHAYSDKHQLSGFVGGLPATCLQNTPRTELCEWPAGDRLPGWRPMAQAIGTRDRVNLICELFLSGAPREPGSCTAHPRRSNRAAWEAGGRRTGHGAITASERAKIAQANRRTTDQWMSQADTMLRMSRLMGAIPDDCMSRSETEQVCSWRTTARTFGHGVLAVWIDVSKTKKIRLRCVLPKDGGPRAPHSCHAQVGT
jgi:hypothetical protein